MATIYLSSLNGTDGLDVLAEFSGAKVPLPATSVPIVPTANAGNIKLSDIQGALKFRTSHLSGSTNAPSSITAAADTPTNLTVLSKGIMLQNTVGRSSNLGLNTRPNTAFLGQLSKEIFGSEHSADLFNNQLQLATKYVDACDNLNYKIEQNTSGVAATETVNALMLEKSERFALKYNTTVNPAPTASQVNTAVVFRGADSGVAKEVTVETANNSTIMRMTKEKQGAFRQNTAKIGDANDTEVSNVYVKEQMKLPNNSIPHIINVGNLTNSINTIAITGGQAAGSGIALVASVTSGGSGAGLTVAVVPAANTTRLTSVTVVNPGKGYKVGDTITVPAVSTGTASQHSTFDYQLVTGDFVAQALVRGKYTLTDATGGTPAQVTSKRYVTSSWVAGVGTGVVFEVDVQGVTNQTIASVTVTNGGSGYAINDVITIANGVGGGIIEFTVTDAMLIVDRFKNNAGLLSAFRARYIGMATALGARTITVAGAYGRAGATINSVDLASVRVRTGLGNAPGPTIKLFAPGSTSDTINAVNITGAMGGLLNGDVIKLTIPTNTSAFFGLWNNSQVPEFTVTDAMLTTGTLNAASNALILAQIKTDVLLGSLSAAPAVGTYSNVALQTPYGSGAIIGSISCSGNANSSITSVSISSGGTGYKVGQLIRIPSGKMGTNSAAITVTLTAAMINGTGGIRIGPAGANATSSALLTALQASGNGELLVSSTENDVAINPNNAVDGTYRLITLNSSHHGKGAEIEVTLNGPDPSNIQTVKFTKHGSGYRAGDTVIVPATTLGATSTEIRFQVTDLMLMHSGAIFSNINQTLALPSNTSGTTSVNTLGSGANGVELSLGSGYTTDGDGKGAKFKLTYPSTAANTPVTMSVITVTDPGYGFRNGDSIHFQGVSNAQGRPTNTWTYKLVTSNPAYTGVTSAFVKGEILTSIQGPGGNDGGVGPSSLITIGNASGNQQAGLNAVQVSMLNETLDQNTEVPLEAGDTIQSLYKITSKAGQTNSSTHPITIEYDAIFEFVLAV